MSRVFMFNPLVRERPGPYQNIVVNSDSTQPYSIRCTYPTNKYVPLSTDGARVPGPPPQGNAFCDVNTLAVTVDDDNGPWNYRFDLPSNQGDLIAYFFRDRIVLLAQDGDYRKTYLPDDGMAAAAKPARTPTKRSQSGLAVSKNGTFFVFNVSPDSIKFSANGGPAPLAEWAPTTTQKPYTPAVLPLDRVLNESDGRGKIFNGANRIEITSEMINPWRFTLNVKQSLNQNLFLYMLRDRWLMFDRYGELLDSGENAPTKSLAESLGRATKVQPRRRR